MKFHLTDSPSPMPSASGPPASLNVSATSSSSISVFWEEPLAPNGKIDGYELTVVGDAVQVQNVTEHTITGLAKNSNYNISLKVILVDDDAKCLFSSFLLCGYKHFSEFVISFSYVCVSLNEVLNLILSQDYDSYLPTGALLI